MIHELLKKYWHYNAFRPRQEEIIMHILGGKDALGILPTGGGKSICYQLPTLAKEGACLVISPLIALMKDQMMGLLKRDIPALAVFSGMSTEEVDEAYRKMSTGKYKFLFVSPERLLSAHFLDYLIDWHINLIAVDEAHCISQWGYDFRPPYLEIAAIRKFHPTIPILALTASATPFVQQDIIERLALQHHKTFFTTFARPNISFSCFEVDDKTVKTIEILSKVKGSSIVYCRSRRHTKELSEALQSQGISADYYHAGLDHIQRSKKQDNWMNAQVQTMVCTNAFGMGIDKSDVRCVIHYDIPETPEAYYQEAGRAGRDEQKAYAVLLYQKKDLSALLQSIDLRYPSTDTIKEVYESLAYYLEIPLDGGLENTYDFEVVDFSRKFKLNLIEVMSSIKILEQQGYWSLSESVFLPSKISMIGSKEDLEMLELQHPDVDEIIKQVLRLYGGLWHHHVSIRELLIAQHVGASIDYVQMILRKLHGLGIIDYIEAKDQPQLFYLHDRLPKQQLRIDKTLIEILKKRYQDRVQFMIRFVQQDKFCRANYLIHYFSEAKETKCGICDNCLQSKKELQGKEDFNLIRNQLLIEIDQLDKVNIDLFLKKHSTLMQANVMKIIRFLLDDKQLALNDAGELIKKK
ncbi:MAG: RecQ family ATP-dependent DNA helicase [Bacteroidetes bacterium]|nr:RecQ family ATP-dependent DNA helicase [Bacteroidota bacterium]